MYSFWFLTATWFFFGPVAGFHHMIQFGITGYLMLNGENPGPDAYMWGSYEVRLFLGRLAVSVLLWVISVTVVFRWLRYLDSKDFIT
jgi:hypothetical protein